MLPRAPVPNSRTCCKERACHAPRRPSATIQGQNVGSRASRQEDGVLQRPFGKHRGDGSRRDLARVCKLSELGASDLIKGAGDIKFCLSKTVGLTPCEDMLTGMTNARRCFCCWTPGLEAYLPGRLLNLLLEYLGHCFGVQLLEHAQKACRSPPVQGVTTAALRDAPSQFQGPGSQSRRVH